MTKKDINAEFIRNYCRNDEAAKAWYNTFIATPVVVLDENKQPVLKADGTAETRKPTFIELQLAFIKAYFPEFAPKPKRAKKESIYDAL